MPESLVFSHAKISLNPCFLTFWSTEVDPYSLFSIKCFLAKMHIRTYMHLYNLLPNLYYVRTYIIIKIFITVQCRVFATNKSR